MINAGELLTEVRPCSENELTVIKYYISQLSLDSIELRHQEFLTARISDKIVGFGRIRNYSGCCELCSLGVLEEFRLKGIGRNLVSELVQKSEMPLYVVTVIPEFFRRFGFIETLTYPEAIAQKLSYCKSSLSVPESYHVMLFN